MLRIVLGDLRRVFSRLELRAHLLDLRGLLFELRCDNADIFVELASDYTPHCLSVADLLGLCVKSIEHSLTIHITSDDLAVVVDPKGLSNLNVAKGSIEGAECASRIQETVFPRIRNSVDRNI